MPSFAYVLVHHRQASLCHVFVKCGISLDGAIPVDARHRQRGKSHMSQDLSVLTKRLV